MDKVSLNMLISIIIPVFNTSPKLIDECLKSIELHLKKWRESIEVIIVNDGSTSEDTIKYLSESSYTVLNQSNKGLPSARNFGIFHASGKYIFPLDSDDIVSEYIGLYINELINNKNIDILFGDLYTFGDVDHIYKLDKTTKLEFFLDDKFIPSCSIYKRDLWKELNGYDESFITSEDYDFYCRAFSINAKLKYMEMPNYYWRIIKNSKSLSQKNEKLFREYQIKSRNKTLLSTLSKQDINDYIIQKLKNKKHRLLALLIYLVSPRIYLFLNKLRIFSYGTNFIK